MTRKKIVDVLVLTLFVACVVFVCHASQLDVPSASRVAPFRGDSPTPITPQEPWYLVRSVDSNDAALTGVTKSWDSAVQVLRVMRPWNTVTLSFLAYGDGGGDPNAPGDPNEGGFNYDVFACREHGSMEKVCSGSVSISDIEASCMPDSGVVLADPNHYKWAEGSASLVTSQSWDAAVGCTTVADEIGKISWDPLGAPYLYVRVYGITAITKVYVLVTGR